MQIINPLIFPLFNFYTPFTIMDFQYQFKPGDLIKSNSVSKFKIDPDLGESFDDYGIVIKLGPRPDDGEGRPGYLVRWAKEGMEFWIDADDEHYTLAAAVEGSHQ